MYLQPVTRSCCPLSSAWKNDQSRTDKNEAFYCLVPSKNMLLLNDDRIQCFPQMIWVVIEYYAEIGMSSVDPMNNATHQMWQRDDPK